MEVTDKYMQDLKKLIKDRAENYPDLKAMVASGQLSYRSGWYEAKSKEAYDAIVQYSTSVRVKKNGVAEFKVSRESKQLKALAKKL